MRKFAVLLFALALTACTSAPRMADVGRASVVSTRFGDVDPHDWTGANPYTYPVHGIDVSRYQGAIDWPTVRQSGAVFAFIKATEGGDSADPNFRENWRAAAQAGVPRGAYHFYYFCRTATEQAAWFMANVPRDPGALPPVLDIEWNHASKNCRYRPGPETVRSEMQVFMGHITRHYGKRPVVYSTVDFFAENELWRLGDIDFWLRSVAGHPTVTYPNQRWTFWQYTGTGVVPGIAGKTDINVFGGTQAQWQQWVARN